MASHSPAMQDKAEDLSLRAQLLQKQCEILQLQASLAQADASNQRAQELARGASQALEHAHHSLQTQRRNLVVPDLPPEVMRDLELAMLSLKTGLEGAAASGEQQRKASPPPVVVDKEDIVSINQLDNQDDEDDQEAGYGCCSAAPLCDSGVRLQGRLSHLTTVSACSTRPPTAGTNRVSTWSSCCSPAQSRPQSAVGAARSRPQSAAALRPGSGRSARPQSAGQLPPSAAAPRPGSGRRARPQSSVEQRGARCEPSPPRATKDCMIKAPTFEELGPQRAAQLRRLDAGYILKDLRTRLTEDRQSRETRLYMLTSRPDLAIVEHPPFFKDEAEQLSRSPTLLERADVGESGRKSFRHRLAKYTKKDLAAKMFE